MKPFSLLKPVKTEKPPKQAVKILSGHLNYRRIEELLGGMEDLIALDIETKGNKSHDYDSVVIGIGLADSKTIIYFDLTLDKYKVTYHRILAVLMDLKKQLFGFNINFDASYLHRDYSSFIGQSISGPGLIWHNWVWDCYGLYKQLANEGWKGQEWGLKSAQMDLLGWDDKGNLELNDWLINNDCYTSVSLTNKKGYEWSDKLNRFVRPDMSKLHLAPPEVVGYYCGLDAASTYMLLSEVFLPAVQTLPVAAQELFQFYHSTLFITNVKWHIEQQLRGIKINIDNLIKYIDLLKMEIKETKEQFLTHPDIKDYIKEFNELKLKSSMGKEPAKLTKAGKPSKNYDNWLAKKNKLLSQNLFNVNSGQQKQWLFYEKLGYPVLVKTKKDNPAVDKKALLNWGEPGKLLKKHNDKDKELGYVESCIKQVQDAGDGRLHPQYRIPGTLTCRIAGAGAEVIINGKKKKFNVQQQPKSKGYLKEWVPSEDFLTWVDADVESLEAVVLAELSKDKTMRYLYDPSSPKNDIYLYVGSFLPGIKDRILAAGYNPNDPTLDGIASAKKEAKKERQIAKQCVLGFQYGMGPKKLRATLQLEGVNLTEQESFDIYNAYWNLFSGIKQFNKHLELEWKRRKGWVYNGIGRPVGCNEMFLKDINNRVVQSTGHDILMYVNYQLYLLRNESKLDFWPIIIDWHDSSLVECQKSDSQEVLNLFNTAYKRVNDWLKGDLVIRTKPMIVNNLAESKCE